MIEPKEETSYSMQEKFMELYEQLFPVVAVYISKRGGSYEEAKDVFQDALIIYHEKVTLDTLEIENAEAYITQTSKYIWFKRFKESQYWVEIEDFEESIASSVEEYEKPVQGKLIRFIQVAGAKCMNLLKAFYYQRASLDDIAEEYGFSGTRSATVQKYKCLEKLRDEVKRKEISYADFFE